MRTVPQRWRPREEDGPEGLRRLVGDLNAQAASGLAAQPQRVTRTLAYRAPERWIAATLLNSWAAKATYAPPGFWKDEAGVVHLRGVADSGTYGASTILTLPDGYRPAYPVSLSTTQTNATFDGDGRINISTAGVVTAPTIVSIQTGVSTLLSFDNLSFDAANPTPQPLAVQPVFAGLGFPPASVVVTSCRDVTADAAAPLPRIAWRSTGAAVVLTQLFGLLPGHQYVVGLEIASE